MRKIVTDKTEKTAQNKSQQVTDRADAVEKANDFFIGTSETKRRKGNEKDEG